MSCDIKTSENLDEYENVLSEISAICRNNNARYICIAGDFNTDFNRNTSWHTQLLNQFMNHENLICLSDFSQSKLITVTAMQLITLILLLIILLFQNHYFVILSITIVYVMI